MEETRSQLVMVTEAVFASAENLLWKFEGLPRALVQARADVKLSELEVKAGLLQVCHAWLLSELCEHAGTPMYLLDP